MKTYLYYDVLCILKSSHILCYYIITMIYTGRHTQKKTYVLHDQSGKRKYK